MTVKLYYAKNEPYKPLKLPELHSKGSLGCKEGQIDLHPQMFEEEMIEHSVAHDIHAAGI